MTLGQAINRAMQQSPVGKQTVLADLLGIDQTAVSKMIRGKVAVTVERVAEIEDLCQVPRGQILVWSGYVSEAAVSDEQVERGRRLELPRARLRKAVRDAQEATRPHQPAIEELPAAASSGHSRGPAKNPSRRPRPEPNE